MTFPLISPQLLNAVPEPVLVIDKVLKQAVVANSLFVKLTAFTQTELSGMPLEDLIPGGDTLDLFTGEERKIKLSCRSRSAIDVLMTSAQADATGQWLLLIFRRPEEVAQQQANKELLKLLPEFMALLEKDNHSIILKEAAQLAAKICSAGQVAIYMAASEQPVLRLLATFPEITVIPETGNVNGLPVELPATDLGRLDMPAIWMPGRRLHTELYKAARVSGYSYLASVPIGLMKKPSNKEDDLSGKMYQGFVGLLVVSDLDQQPLDNLLEILQLLGIQLQIFHSQRVKLEELESGLDRFRRALVLRNGQIENQREGVLVVSPDMAVIEINPAAEWMLEYTPAEVSGQPVQNILIGTKSLLPAIQEALSGIPTHNLSDIALHRRSGQSFPAQLRIIPIMEDKSGSTVAGVSIFISDVSEHEQIQVRTQQLEHRALLGEVIAVFAHEVRNPINNIATGLQLMESRLAPLDNPQIASPEDRQNQLIQRMLGDCQRLNHLMESVLQFSRPIEPKLEPLDLYGFLQRFLDRWRPRLSRVNAVPYLSSEQNLPMVMADSRALEQVFTNLISNAVHAMTTSGGTLAIKLFENRTIANFPQVEITVSDTGPGIPEEFRSRLFEPFATTSATGTGLGLAITKRIITAHRGSIWVESYPGGTIFHILLPAESAPGGE